MKKIFVNIMLFVFLFICLISSMISPCYARFTDSVSFSGYSRTNIWDTAPSAEILEDAQDEMTEPELDDAPESSPDLENALEENSEEIIID